MSDRPYVTERTKMWRTRDIKPWFVEAIDKIEQYGCQTMTVKADVVSDSFTYSTGIYDTHGGPEIITVGLYHETAQFALNEAMALIGKGIDLTQGRHRDLVGNVEAEFRPVDPKWLHHIMLRTDWFYEGADVPVLQLVYPDMENRFPNEPDFDKAFEQPNLSIGAEHGSMAHDLWASYDKSSSLSRWKFPCSPHTSAYLSRTIYEKEEPITYVSHDADGDWQFLGNLMLDGGGPVLTCLHHPIDGDRALEELSDLPLGWCASREKPGSPWERFEHPPEEPDDDAPIT